MDKVILVPYFIYESFKATNTQLELITDIGDGITDALKNIPDLDLYHLLIYNSRYNMFLRTFSELQKILKHREIHRLYDTLFINHLLDGSEYEMIPTTDTLFVILKTNMNANMVKEIFNYVYKHSGNTPLYLNDIVNNYIQYLNKQIKTTTQCKS